MSDAECLALLAVALIAGLGIGVILGARWGSRERKP